MKIFRKQSGASLLTILLLIAVVGVIVLAGSRALQESSRSSAVLATETEARHAAMTGIWEGILLWNTQGAGIFDREYGTITDRTLATSYSLTPMRRGFLANTSCTSQSGAEQQNQNGSTIDKSCPYYDLAIRDRGAYSSAQTDISKFALSSRDFPNGVAEKVALRSTSVWLNVPADPNIQRVNIALCVLYTSCGGASPVAPGGSLPISDPSLTYHYMQITVIYNSVPANPITVLTASQSPSQTVLGKGYITIDATGYSGETQVRMVYTLRAGQIFLSPFTGVFDQYGILK